MKKISLLIVIAAIIFSVSSCRSKSKSKEEDKKEQSSKITLFADNENNKIDVLIDGKLFTSYRWPDNVCKPILYPIFTSAGTEITRGFPINPRIGERPDHAHQIGMWLTYGNVNGFDFWGNGSQGLGTTNENGGLVKHQKVEKMEEGKEKATLVTKESWVDPSGNELLEENTEYHFIKDGETLIIDRITRLTATDKDVSMPDTKEGMFGIRVARQLELPSEGMITVYKGEGEHEKIEGSSDKTVSGNYLSSEGISGLEVWGTRARWMDLYGIIGTEKISLVICDHPNNPSYPTYWHARGYGLFAANPLGWEDFTKGEKQLNFSIPSGESATFRYRVIISSGSYLSEEEINEYTENFAEMY
jgi:hypothetical protein